MGLDVSHDCWSGAYSAFMRWRTKLAEVAGFPPLVKMAGYDSPGLSWRPYEKDPLTTLLDHSDCEGKLAAADCAPLAARLEELLPKLDGEGGGHIGLWRDKTERFIAGLRRAAEAGEDVEFY